MTTPTLHLFCGRIAAGKSAAEYARFMAYFVPPAEAEGFHIVRHPPC